MQREQTPQLLQRVYRFFNGNLNVVKQAFAEKVKHCIQNLVFTLKVTIERGSSQSNLAGQPGHVQTVYSFTGNESQGCLSDLLPPHLRAKFYNSHDFNMLIYRCI